jgi:hypothetical protein
VPGAKRHQVSTGHSERHQDARKGRFTDIAVGLHAIQSVRMAALLELASCQKVAQQREVHASQRIDVRDAHAFIHFVNS